jgi:serine protease Do
MAAGSAVSLAQALPTDRMSCYSYAPLVKRVSPAVVNIYTTTTARATPPPFPFPRVRRRAASGCRIRWAPACWYGPTG